MRKLIAQFLCVVVFLAALACPLSAYATTPLDPTADASLTLHYQKEEQAFPGLSIQIYRVAEAFPDGSFECIAPFSSYPIQIHGITEQEQWQKIAMSLSSYIVADQLVPYREAKTNEAGTVVFEHLETGLYLVNEVVAENDNGTYVFNRFMVYLPTPQPDGTFDYDVEARPKCAEYVSRTEYRVSKLWQDSGYADKRPEQVTVDIYKDGALQESQLLNAQNNWSYLWSVSADDHCVWSVAERDVPERYTVTIQQNGNSFLIINTCKAAPLVPENPQTGGSSNITLYSMLMCISGILLIILGVYYRRRKGK